MFRKHFSADHFNDYKRNILFVLSCCRAVRSLRIQGVRLFVKCSLTWRATTSDPPSHIWPLCTSGPRAPIPPSLPPSLPDRRMIYSPALAVAWLCDPLPLCVWRGLGRQGFGPSAWGTVSVNKQPVVPQCPPCYTDSRSQLCCRYGSSAHLASFLSKAAERLRIESD